MTHLDGYIDKHIEAFNDEEPLNGHFERFGKKLQGTTQPKTHTTTSLIIKIAAVILLGAIISYLTIREFDYFNGRKEQFFTSADYPELREAEQYYNNQVDIYYAKLNNLKFNDDQGQKKQILNELTAMDKQVRNMKKDLLLSPDDERIVYAILNYYQVKLELMDMIITKTQKSSGTIL